MNNDVASFYAKKERERETSSQKEEDLVIFAASWAPLHFTTNGGAPNIYCRHFVRAFLLAVSQ